MLTGPVRAAFAEVRDAAESRLKGGDKDWEDLDDWLVLNDVVGEPEKTLEWFDRIKNDPKSAATLERTGFRLERLLEEQERWADLMLLYKDPTERLRREHAHLERLRNMPMPEGMEGRAGEMRAWADSSFRGTAGKLYGACLAADRAEDADRLAAEAVKLDPSGAMRAALVEGAIAMKQPRVTQHRLLDEAEQAGEKVADLRRQLAEAIEQAKRKG